MLTVDPRWTKKQLSSAQSMWLAGIPASKIAVELGKTRGAVVGKLRLLGLFKIANRPRIAPTPKRKVVKPAAPPKAPPEVPIPKVFQPGSPVLLEGLKSHHCRAILGDVGPDGFALYCGDPKAEGSSWCSFHLGLYTQPPR